jgi:hypothetical protein
VIEPEDSQGYIWDPRQNRNMAVIRVISAIDPTVLKIVSSDWRALIKGACEAWERSGVVAFTQTFGALDSPDFVEGAAVLKLQETEGVYPGGVGGYTNADLKWRDNLEHGALVWLDPDLTKGMFQGVTREAFAQYVVCHELGHVLGLAHRPDSIMAASDMEGKSTTPTAGDLDRLREIYI